MKRVLLLLVCIILSCEIAFAQTGPTDVDLDVPPAINNPSGPIDLDVPPAINNPSGPIDLDVPPAINNPSGPTQPGPGAQPTNPQPVTATGSFLNISLPNSHGLPGEAGLESMLKSLLQNALYFIGLIGILGLLYAAIQLWLSHGKADSIGSAKVNIFNVILGLAIVLLAWTGVTVVLRFLGF